MSDSCSRPPAVAGQFYPGTKEACEQALAEFRLEEPKLPKELIGAHIVGGVVPHAGWSYSGAIALAVFDLLAQASPKPETVLIFATSHRAEIRLPSVQAAGAWQVPGEDLAIDEEFARIFLEEAGGGLLIDWPAIHLGDHAIEVQLPILKETLPGVRFVPVAMPMCPLGPEVGIAAAKAAQKFGREVVALASTDLTHYGPNYYRFAPHGVGLEAHRWSKDVNDGLFLEKVIKLDAEGAFEAGARDQSACGPAAAAAVIAFAKERGATRATLIDHRTSWETNRGRSTEPQDFVGYAALAMAGT